MRTGPKSRATAQAQGLVLGLVALAMLGLSAGAAAWSARPAATTPTIELALSPDGPAVTELSLQALPTAATARLTFFIRQTGDTPLTKASLSTVSTDLDLDITAAAGGTDLTIPAAGTAVEMVATVSGLSKAVDTRLDLYLQAEGGIAITVGVLRVLRSDAPALTVVGDSGSRCQLRAGPLGVQPRHPAEVRHRRRRRRHGQLHAPPGRLVAAGPAGTVGRRGSARERRRHRRLGVVEPDPDAWGRPFRGRPPIGATITFVYGSGLGQQADRAADGQAHRHHSNSGGRSRGSCARDARILLALLRLLGDRRDHATSKVVFRETGGQEAGFDDLKVLRTRVDDNGTMVQANDVTANLELPDGQTGEGLDHRPAGVGRGDRGPGRRARGWQVRGAAARRHTRSTSRRRNGHGPGADALPYALVLLILGSLLSFALRWWIGNGRKRLGIRVRLDGVTQALAKVVEARNTTPADRATVVAQVRDPDREGGGSRAARSGAGPEISAAVDDLLVRVGLLDEWLEVGETHRREGDERRHRQADDNRPRHPDPGRGPRRRLRRA